MREGGWEGVREGGREKEREDVTKRQVGCGGNVYDRRGVSALVKYLGFRSPLPSGNKVSHTVAANNYSPLPPSPPLSPSHPLPLLVLSSVLCKPFPSVPRIPTCVRTCSVFSILARNAVTTQLFPTLH